MNIKDIKLIKGMVKDKVNELISEWLILEDDIYLGAKHNHNWRCKCGNVFERRWDNIKVQNTTDCGCVEYNKQEERYKYEVEKTGEYEYIRSFRKGDRLPNGKVIKCSPYIQIKHKYCGSIYEVKAELFVNCKVRCSKCCGSYENSFAYHIEVELGEPLKKYWDFEKNIVNPYHISKGMNAKNSKGENTKVWIKCTEKEYHGSYEISCISFIYGSRCSSCNPRGNHKVHPLDSFGYKHFDKVLSWHPDNKISPFRVSPGSDKKYKFICPECGYEWNASIYGVSSGSWCPQCASSKGEQKISSWLRLNNIDFIPQKEFDGLLGLGGGNLSYDFYLPDYNLLIEYQGEQHETFIKGIHGEIDVFYRQQEHDRRKREYAYRNEYSLFEIWYYDFDNIEEMLNTYIDKF